MAEAPLRSSACPSPHLYSCLPFQETRPSSPASSSSADVDLAAHSAVEDDGSQAFMAAQQQQPPPALPCRSNSCSKLPGKSKLLPSFKSLLQRAHSLGYLPPRHSHTCTPAAAAAQGNRSGPRKARPTRCAPKGHVAVYVEAGQERHVVPIAYLSHPHFQVLLERAEREFGLRPTAPGLRIPCSLSELHHTLHQIRTQ